MTPLNKLVSILAPIMGKEVDDPEVLELVVEIVMAMREPSEAMVAAADVVPVYSALCSRGRWRAMIDALLTEGG